MRKFIALILALGLVCGLFTGLTALAAEGPDPTESEAAPAHKLSPRVEAMLTWAMDVAKDDTHGYSQAERFGPDYDCTSLVCTALMEAGFALEDYTSTGGLVAELPELGFTVYRRGETEPQRGDILIQLGVHAELCLGAGGCVAARQDHDGRSGDGNGREIDCRFPGDDYGCPFCKYEQYNYILRYEGTDEAAVLPPDCLWERIPA